MKRIKYTLAGFMIAMSGISCYAQQTDPTLTATVLLQTEELKSIHKKRKTTQEKIIAAETAVTLALDRVHSVENKMLEYLSNAQGAMQNIYQIKRAAELVTTEIPKNTTLLKNSVKGKKMLNILIQNGMNIYNWKGYDFVGTAADFAGIHCKCKAKTYTNSVKYVTRHRYNNMDGREQKAYDDKRKRAKRAYCIYTDDNAESGYLVSKKDFEAADLPEVVKKYEPIFLTYRDVYIPLNFIGESRVENPVPSAMLLFRKIAERFSMQSMFALGYFNTRDNEENPDVCLSHTTIYLKYPCGIIFQFDSCMCDDGVDNCRLTLIRKGENDIYNCFRDGRILTVHGIEMVCRPNPDCRRADYFFHMKQFQDRLKNYGYNIILFGNMVSRRSYWPPKAPSPTQTKERMVEASLRCLRLRGASSQERQMSQTVYSTPVICNTIFMAYIKQFKNRTNDKNRRNQERRGRTL